MYLQQYCKFLCILIKCEFKKKLTICKFKYSENSLVHGYGCKYSHMDLDADAPTDLNLNFANLIHGAILTYNQSRRQSAFVKGKEKKKKKGKNLSFIQMQAANPY